MGVKLKEIITRKEVDFQKLAGKIIAVDAPNIIMSLFNFSRKNPDGSYGGLILDRTQRPISHLYNLIYRVNFFYSKKMFPVFVFDGKVSELKRVITKNQLKDYLFTKKWYEEAMNSGRRDVAREIASSREYLWQNIIEESKQLIGALGVPYIESPGAAEAQCAHLVKRGIVHFSNSQDFDSLLFGCLSLIQNLSKSLRRKIHGKWRYEKIIPLRTNLKNNLKKLGISIFQLVDLSLMIGTDYFPGVTQIGPKKGLKFIKQYKTIENIILAQGKSYDFSQLTRNIIRQVRKIFLFPEVNEKETSFFWNPPHKTQVLSLLCEEHFLNKERVSNNLDKLEVSYKKCKNHFVNEKGNVKLRQLSIDKISFN